MAKKIVPPEIAKQLRYWKAERDQAAEILRANANMANAIANALATSDVALPLLVRLDGTCYELSINRGTELLGPAVAPPEVVDLDLPSPLRITPKVVNELIREDRKETCTLLHLRGLGGDLICADVRDRPLPYRDLPDEATKAT